MNIYVRCSYFSWLCGQLLKLFLGSTFYWIFFTSFFFSILFVAFLFGQYFVLIFLFHLHFIPFCKRFHLNIFFCCFHLNWVEGRHIDFLCFSLFYFVFIKSVLFSFIFCYNFSFYAGFFFDFNRQLPNSFCVCIWVCPSFFLA